MSNAPVWGLVFYVNPPVLPPIAPGRGVVGHYIDRCITATDVMISGQIMVSVMVQLTTFVTLPIVWYCACA